MKFRLTPQGTVRLSEKDVALACLDLLARRRWCCVRTQTGLFMTPDGRRVYAGAVGLPDYFCGHRDHPSFFLETKRPKGKLSEAQIKKHLEIGIAYGIAVATIDRVEALIPWLDAHERRITMPG